jgi:predicted MFS family arabinose efflux permease
MADLFGAGDAVVGVFVGCFGGGAAITSLSLRRIRARLGLERLGVLGLTGFGAGMVVFALSPTPWFAGVALALAGCAFLCAITAVTTRMQRDVAEDVRGRVMALWGVAFLGSRPLAALLHGAVADAAGPRLASGLAACAALGGALVLYRSRDVLGPAAKDAATPAAAPFD